MRLLRWCCLPLLITWMGVALAQGEATRLAPWTLLDQFDRPYTLEPDLRVLLVARGMDASGLLDEALAELGGDYLERHSVVFLADISGMPSLVTKMFALPAMRALPFPIGLARESAVLADLRDGTPATATPDAIRAGWAAPDTVIPERAVEVSG